MFKYRVMVFEKTTHKFMYEFRTSNDPFYQNNNGGNCLFFATSYDLYMIDLNKYYLIIDNN